MYCIVFSGARAALSKDMVTLQPAREPRSYEPARPTVAGAVIGRACRPRGDYDLGGTRHARTLLLDVALNTVLPVSDINASRSYRHAADETVMVNALLRPRQHRRRLRTTASAILGGLCSLTRSGLNLCRHPGSEQALRDDFATSTTDQAVVIVADMNITAAGYIPLNRSPRPCRAKATCLSRTISGLSSSF